MLLCAEHCIEQPKKTTLKPTDPIHECPACSAKIPIWWVRGYCSNCGGDLPQTPDQAEIERLRDALMEIDDVAGYDYQTMPEGIRAKAHEITCEIVMRALSFKNEKLTD